MELQEGCKCGWIPTEKQDYTGHITSIWNLRLSSSNVTGKRRTLEVHPFVDGETFKTWSEKFRVTVGDDGTVLTPEDIDEIQAAEDRAWEEREEIRRKVREQKLEEESRSRIPLKELKAHLGKRFNTWTNETTGKVQVEDGPRCCLCGGMPFGTSTFAPTDDSNVIVSVHPDCYQDFTDGKTFVDLENNRDWRVMN